MVWRRACVKLDWFERPNRQFGRLLNWLKLVIRKFRPEAYRDQRRVQYRRKRIGFWEASNGNWYGNIGHFWRWWENSEQYGKGKTCKNHKWRFQQNTSSPQISTLAGHAQVDVSWKIRVGTYGNECWQVRIKWHRDNANNGNTFPWSRSKCDACQKTLM